MSSIRLSEKHGINPAIPRCYFCGAAKNTVILAGRLPGDQEAPRDAVWDKEPCDKCAGYMEQGIILISVDEKRSKDPQNPYRTGGWAVVTEDFIRRIVQPPELADGICKVRVAFVPDVAWQMLGLDKAVEKAS